MIIVIKYFVLYSYLFMYYQQPCDSAMLIRFRNNLVYFMNFYKFKIFIYM